MIERMFEQGLSELAAEDRSGWSAPARSARLLELLQARERLEAETLRCLGEWDASRAWAEDGAWTPQAWLVHQAPMTRSDAARLIRTARLARDNDRTAKLLATGDVSSSHIEVMARAARHREACFADHEDALLDAARALPPDQFRHVARRWRSLADDALAQDESFDAFKARRLHCSPTFHGTVVVDGELDPDGGAAVIAALEALDTPDPIDTPDGPRSPAQRRADALVQLAELSLAQPPTSRRRTRAADVVVDADTLAGRAPVDLVAARSDVSGVGPVARSVVRRMACDAAVGRVVRQGRSLILDLGRRTPVVSAAQHRALAHRDGGCGFPGCDRPPEWCDGHHIEHWVDGGPTDLDNLVLLCRPHHVACHEGGWRLTRDAEGALQAIPP
jgi:Domain of unknown function (DUF222)/HNH endonuclease